MQGPVSPAGPAAAAYRPKCIFIFSCKSVVKSRKRNPKAHSFFVKVMKLQVFPLINIHFSWKSIDKAGGL